MFLINSLWHKGVGGLNLGIPIIVEITLEGVAYLLLVQHIHYTIDVLATPIVVYPCYRLTRYLLNNISRRVLHPRKTGKSL
jgi:hypothetical protein